MTKSGDCCVKGVDVEWLGMVGTEVLSGCQQNRRSQGHSICCSFLPAHIINTLNLLFPVAVTKPGNKCYKLGCKWRGAKEYISMNTKLGTGFWKALTQGRGPKS